MKHNMTLSLKQAEFALNELDSLSKPIQDAELKLSSLKEKRAAAFNTMQDYFILAFRFLTEEEARIMIESLAKNIDVIIARSIES